MKTTLALNRTYVVNKSGFPILCGVSWLAGLEPKAGRAFSQISSLARHTSVLDRYLNEHPIELEAKSEDFFEKVPLAYDAPSLHIHRLGAFKVGTNATVT